MFRDENVTNQPQAQSVPADSQDVAQTGMLPGPGITPPSYQPIHGPSTGYLPGMPIQGLELARVYIPFQRFGPVFDLTRALDLGTLFPELYRPYPY
ncbi:spore coat associated protein CotJA [Desulforamulus aquiferis]|uniref:Spore coat associated protein CotJA n=1 Tax=Desulforamulus aquiferis TaxID=1397668 RepID=A0AAW7Z9W1_9FIRM|nr:spore coat associated protein CotJA [Desulforamulus aquiferis]MDO7785640.1 spore coat associated protein CotJA [Desulforamulus aquiferis]RYD03228.1 hypothetical protein N752_20565 [Desulforamulus aquiferis]